MGLRGLERPVEKKNDGCRELRRAVPPDSHIQLSLTGGAGIVV